MKNNLLGALFLFSLFSSCKKETAVVPLPVPLPLTTNQKLQAHVWKAHRFFSGADTSSESDNVLIKTATWAFEKDTILKWGGWLSIDPISQKDTLVHSYKLEQGDTRIRSHYLMHEGEEGWEDLWEIVKLTPDTLLVKRLEPVHSGNQSAYLEFLPKK